MLCFALIAAYVQIPMLFLPTGARAARRQANEPKPAMARRGG
jgi:hypothetical protein